MRKTADDKMQEYTHSGSGRPGITHNKPTRAGILATISQASYWDCASASTIASCNASRTSNGLVCYKDNNKLARTCTGDIFNFTPPLSSSHRLFSTNTSKIAGSHLWKNSALPKDERASFLLSVNYWLSPIWHDYRTENATYRAAASRPQ